MSILVVGEVLIDLIKTPDGSITAVAGGGPFNQARTVARLGVPVSFCGGISNDSFGRHIAEILASEGVSTPVSTRAGLLTTLALAEVDVDGAATYTFYTAGTAAPSLQPDDVRIDHELAIFAIGTLGLVLEPIASTLAVLVERLSDTTLLFVDPNCRPGNIPDEIAYRERLSKILSRADVVKVSGDDLAFLGSGSPALETARRLLTQGPRVVLYTDGSASVRVLTQSDEISLPVPPVTVIDTVGAGDAFGGAFLAYWTLGGGTRADLDDLGRLRTAVEQAIVVASITCGRVGADPPWLAEIPA